jgi:hypothetical protein
LRGGLYFYIHGLRSLAHFGPRNLIVTIYAISLKSPQFSKAQKVLAPKLLTNG